MEQVLRPLAEKRGLEPWEKIVNFTKAEWFPSRLSFGRFKGRREVEAEIFEKAEPLKLKRMRNKRGRMRNCDLLSAFLGAAAPE